MRRSRTFSFPWARRLLLPLLAGLLLTPRLAETSSPGDPARWIEQGTRQILVPPEFFFELEVKRLAAELHPGFKAMLPPVEPETGRDYGEQTLAADLADFRVALDRKEIVPPDPIAASEAHEEMRDLIGRESDSEWPGGRLAPAPDEFPSEFSDYHRGARAFHHRQFDAAKAEWIDLLARPPAERRHRTTWATFMLGTTALEEKDMESAVVWFTKIRAAVREGFADSIGLGAASLGWEAFAHLECRRFAPAARLYLEQLAAGDPSAVMSLKAVRRAMTSESVEELASIARDPVLQRLETAAVVSTVTYFFEVEQTEAAGTAQESPWLRALESIEATNIRDAERIGWIAYAHGRYNEAARWLKRADATAPYAKWLKAKLALRAGDLATATVLLSQAVPRIPRTPTPQAKALTGYEVPPDDAAKADLAMLRLGRGEFIQALKLFVQAGRLADAEYVAEAVLTMKELIALVRRDFPAPPKEEVVGTDDRPRDWHDPGENPNLRIRRALARRLTRAERFAEARPYFEEHQQGLLDQYSVLLASTRRAPNRAAKIEALRAAARFVNESGNDLLDYAQSSLMAARLTGQEVPAMSRPVIAITFTEKKNTSMPPVTRTERARLKGNKPGPLRRFLSLYMAADLAWRAAALMPDHEKETARWLNTAGGWLKYQDDAAADRFYQAIERRCSRTVLGQEAIKRRWFVPEPAEAAEGQN